jgi:MFS family permease
VLSAIRSYWAGYALSQVGTAAWRIVLPWSLYKATNDPVQLGLAAAFLLLPELLITPVAGWLVDRLRRSLCIVVADGTRGVAYLACAVAVLGANDKRLVVYLLYVLLAADGALQIVSQAARIAILNDFAVDDRNRLRSLLSTDRSVRLLGDIAGPALGGLLATASLSTGLIVNGGSFVLAALSAAPLVATSLRARHDAAEPIHWMEGLALAKANGRVRDALARQFVVNLCVPVVTIGVPISVAEHGDPKIWLGLSITIFAVGALLSARLRRRHPKVLLTDGRVGWPLVALWISIAVLAFALPTQLRFLMFFPLGVLTSWTLIDTQMQWQSAINAAQVGRVSAVASAMARIGALASLAVIGALVSRLGLVSAAAAYAAVVGGLSLVVFIAQRRGSAA